MPGVAKRAAIASDVLVHAIAGSDAKRRRARAAVAHGRIVPSRAPNETARVPRRKAGTELPAIAAAVAAIRQVPRAVPRAETTHARALEIARDTDRSTWDAWIPAAPIEAGRGEVLSEGMRDGRDVRGTTIRNPFGKRAG